MPQCQAGPSSSPAVRRESEGPSLSHLRAAAGTSPCSRVPLKVSTAPARKSTQAGGQALTISVDVADADAVFAGRRACC